MKKFSAVSFLLLLGLGVAMGQSSLEKKVLFIGIDGVRSDALQQANTPTLDSIAATGVSTYTSWHLGITVSGPSWSTMLCGVWEDKHGVTNNNYTGSNYYDYPYFVTRAKEYRPDIKAVQITSWNPMSVAVYNDGWDQKIVVPDDPDVVTAALSQLQDPDLDVLFVHIDNCDATGHSQGFSPLIPNYITAIQTADANVHDILNGLRARPNYANEDWLILFTTDHGGIGLGHGGTTQQEKKIWWMATGAQLPNVELVIDINQSSQWGDAPVLADIAVTALDHLLDDVSPAVEPEQVVDWDLDGRSWLFLRDETSRLGNANALSRIQVLPNPNNGQFAVRFPANLNGTLDYSILDATGRALQTGTYEALGASSDLQFNLEGLAAGLYFFQVQQGVLRHTSRIVIR